MTTPKISTVYRRGTRFYVHPETGQEVPGVTSVLNALPKPALKPWAAKVVAQTAVAQHATIAHMIEGGDESGAVDYLKRSPDRESGAARDFGTASHAVLEAMSHGDTVDLSEWPEDIRDDLEGVMRNFSGFLEEYKPEFLFQEETVWSDTFAYAGSFDAIARIGDEIAIIDYKTNKSGIYGETALQLAAYRHADLILHQSGETTPIPPIDGGLALWIRPDKWQVHPLDTSPEVFEVFTALRQYVYPWTKGWDREAVGKPINEAAQRRKGTRKGARA